MASVCISNFVNDARDPRAPIRASYMSLYKWPESDAEFVRSNGRSGNNNNSYSNSSHVLDGHPRVVDSISCRQMYLRSYKFSRKETVPEKTQKCFGRVKEKVGSNSFHGGRKKRSRSSSRRRRQCLILRKMKEISCAALFRIFHRFLSCAASVDVVDEND